VKKRHFNLYVNCFKTGDDESFSFRSHQILKVVQHEGLGQDAVRQEGLEFGFRFLAPLEVLVGHCLDVGHRQDVLQSLSRRSVIAPLVRQIDYEAVNARMRMHPTKRGDVD